MNGNGRFGEATETLAFRTNHRQPHRTKTRSVPDADNVCTVILYD